MQSPARRQIALFAMLLLAPAVAVLDAGCSDDGELPAAVDAGTEAQVATEPDSGSAPPDAAGPSCAALDAGVLPEDLRCTGLYSDFDAKTVAAQNRAFTPGLVFWSDGAEKERWLFIPDGQKIDSSNMEAWVFPVGTKVWKQFKLGGKRVETRFLWKTGDGIWQETTYRWNAGETAATRLRDGEYDGKGGYEIPSEGQCSNCHNGREDHLLGVEPVSLGLPGAVGITLGTLKAEGKLTVSPDDTTIALPGNATAGDALGWLHVNCGSCHAPEALGAGFTGLHLRLSANAYFRDGGSDAAIPVTATDTYKTAVNKPHTVYTNEYKPDAGFVRIKPKDVAHSVLYLVDTRRGLGQMPPLATHKVDEAGVAKVAAWIESL